jgi:hypothetical protein
VVSAKQGALVLPRGLGLRIRNGRDELVDHLAARFAAQILYLLHLDICVLLRVLLSLLVARAVLHHC